MEQTRLDRLIMAEVSGVDEPANQLPGWMVTKSADGADPYLVLAVEMEAITKAADSKKPYGNVKYADPGYQEDGKKRYPLDTEEHIRAAWSYINQADNASAYTPEQLAKIKAAIKSAMKGLGAEVTAKAGRSSFKLANIKTALGLGDSPGQEGLDMDRDELTAILDEREDALVTKVAEALVAKSAPAEGEGATETAEHTEPEAAPAAEAPAYVTEEQVAKAIEDGVKAGVEGLRADMTEVFEKLIERFETTEKHIGIAARTSLDGQEAGAEGNEPVEKSAPDLGDAIAAALKR